MWIILIIDWWWKSWSRKKAVSRVIKTPETSCFSYLSQGSMASTYDKHSGIKTMYNIAIKLHIFTKILALSQQTTLKSYTAAETIKKPILQRVSHGYPTGILTGNWTPRKNVTIPHQGFYVISKTKFLEASNAGEQIGISWLNAWLIKEWNHKGYLHDWVKII